MYGKSLKFLTLRILLILFLLIKSVSFSINTDKSIVEKADRILSGGWQRDSISLFIPTKDITSIKYSNDSKYLYTTDSSRNLRIWNAGTGEIVNDFNYLDTLKKDRIIFLQLSNDLKTLFVLGTDRYLRLWNTETGLIKKIVLNPSYFVTDTYRLITNDDKYLISYGSTFHKLNIETGIIESSDTSVCLKSMWSYGIERFFKALSSNDSILYLAENRRFYDDHGGYGHYGCFSKWDFKTGKSLEVIKGTSLNNLLVSPNDRFLYYDWQWDHTFYAGGKFIDTGERGDSLVDTYNEFKYNIHLNHDPLFSPSSRRFMGWVRKSNNLDNWVIYSLPEGNLLTTLESKTRMEHFNFLNDDELFFLSWDDDIVGEFIILNIINKTKIGSFKTDPKSKRYYQAPHILTISPDKLSFATFSFEDKLRLYKMAEMNGVEENQALINDFNISPNPASDFIEISLSGVILSEAKNPEIRIYDVFGSDKTPLPPFEKWGKENSSSQYSLLNTQYSTKIDVSALSAGLYFVRVGGKVGKFVKI